VRAAGLCAGSEGYEKPPVLQTKQGGDVSAYDSVSGSDRRDLPIFIIPIDIIGNK
jgi:hypothetical protein